MGSVANRYDGNFFHYPLSWSLKRRNIVSHISDSQENYQSLSQKDLNTLSPAEKYDLVVGDTSFSFSKSVVSRIDQLADNSQIALWSGVCHGWSPASLTFPRPVRAIDVPIFDGRTVTFYPSDIKALSSYLWGQSFAQGSVKVAGRQCKSGGKRKKGRLVDPDCFDVNPAFFHVAITHQIGKKRQGIIMDRNFKKRVMNQPIFKYNYAYYSPVKKEISVKTQRVKQKPLAEAITTLRDYRRDPYEDYRAPNTKYVVGIEMEVTFANETLPKQRETDSTRFDATDSNIFNYELELDESLNIIGGEWVLLTPPVATPKNGGPMRGGYWYEHPDLIWIVPNGLEPYSVADGDISSLSWNANTPAPAEFKNASIKAASNTGIDFKTGSTLSWPQPLNKVVRALLNKAK